MRSDDTGIRVLMVSKNGNDSRIQRALRETKIPIGCICQMGSSAAENILIRGSVAAHELHGEYDVIIIELSDRVLVEKMIYAAIDKVPWQKVIVIGIGPLSDQSYRVSFVPDMSGITTEIKRMMT